MRVIGSRTVNGYTEYAFSDRFRITQGQTYIVNPALTFTTTPPPSPVGLRVSAPMDVLEPGQQVQLTTTGLLQNGSLQDLTSASAWTSYRISNPAKATVDADGFVTAVAPGATFVTATNDAATAVKRIIVAPMTVNTAVEGFVQLTDGTLVDGAEVTTVGPIGCMAITDTSGHFVMPLTLPIGVTTITLRAEVTLAGDPHEGLSSDVIINPGGITDAGVIKVVPIFDALLFPGLALPVGMGPVSVAVGDLDGDNDIDMAVANSSSSTVSILHNNGDNQFATHVTYGVGTTPQSVAAGDLDGDGDLDLAVANGGSSTVSTLHNNGDGTYATHVTYGAGSLPRSVAVGDLDGDNDLDLAVANYGGNISVLLNNGNGTYASHMQYGAGSNPESVVIGDLDGDNDANLAVANLANIVVLLNRRIP